MPDALLDAGIIRADSFTDEIGEFVAAQIDVIGPNRPNSYRRRRALDPRQGA